MAYVPLDRQRARSLRDSGTLPGPVAAHAVTPALLRAHDLTASDEDAEYTALAYAGVSALLTGSDPLRLVLAADVDATDSDDPFGRVDLVGLGWTQVVSLFADEAGSSGRIAEARERAVAADLETAVDDVRVESLLDACDLLWFSPDELDRLPRA